MFVFESFTQFTCQLNLIYIAGIWYVVGLGIGFIFLIVKCIVLCYCIRRHRRNKQLAQTRNMAFVPPYQAASNNKYMNQNQSPPYPYSYQMQPASINSSYPQIQDSNSALVNEKPFSYNKDALKTQYSEPLPPYPQPSAPQKY